MRNFMKVAVLSSLMLMSAGCYSMGKNYNDKDASEVKVGVTTEADLKGKFGEPDYTTTNSDGSKVYTWTFIEGSNFLVTSDSRSKSLEVTVYNGKVTNTRSTYSANFFKDQK